MSSTNLEAHGEDGLKNAPARPKALDQPIPCPLCLYDLRGCAEPRCPECGARYEWDVLTNPERWVHPFVFEHHPNRKLWSFWQTLRATWFPTAFWTGLQPTHFVRSRRLVLYWMLGSWLALLVLPFHNAIAIARQYDVVREYRADARAWLEDPRTASQRARKFGTKASTAEILDRILPLPNTMQILVMAFVGGWRDYHEQLPLAMLFGLPWLVALCLMVFQISLRRARLRTMHLLRCAIYCFDLAAWTAPVLLACLLVGAMPGVRMWLDRAAPDWESTLSWTLLQAALLLGAYRLSVACRLYLQFSHPRATVFAVLCMIGLIELNVVFLRVWLR